MTGGDFGALFPGPREFLAILVGFVLGLFGIWKLVDIGMWIIEQLTQ